MRLTLRTLLAYLDDILEPAQAKEIGDKIKETPNAATLVSRIRDVLRKRRITANSVLGPDSGVDPNLIAEYLDNTLPHEQVAEVEKICLESDVHLAEVAACHQILTLAFGEPADISQQTREHMYALGPVKQNKNANDAARNGADAANPQSQSPGKASPTLPQELKPKPFLIRAVPYIVVSVIASVWVWTLIDDPSLFPQSEQQDQRVAQNDNKPVADIADIADDMPPAEQTEPAPEPGNNSEPDMRLQPDTTVTVTPIPTPPSPTGPLTGPTARVPTPATIPSLPESVPNPTPSVKAPKPETAPKPARNPITELPIQYTSREGLLLNWDRNLEDWLVMPRRSVIHIGDELASPAPFDSTLGVGPRIAQITLLGGTRAQILAPSEAGTFGLNINRGRVILEFDPKTETKQLTLAVGVHKQLWRLELLSPDTRCGVAIELKQPHQPNQLMLENNYSGHLLVDTGTVRFSNGKGQVQIVKAGQALLLPPRVFAAGNSGLSDLLPEQTLTMLIPTPSNWIAEDRMTASLKRQATLFENEFEEDQPLTFSSSALVKDRRPYVSELAVKCLALTDRYVELTMALVQSAHEESRRAAIDGLRKWLPTAKENDALLKAELEKYMMPETAESVHRLLWGYQLKDATDKLTSEQLITWMESSNIAVRELAYIYVSELTGRTYDYRPLAPANQRESSVKRWRNHLAREGALVEPPKPEPTL